MDGWTIQHKLTSNKCTNTHLVCRAWTFHMNSANAGRPMGFCGDADMFTCVINYILLEIICMLLFIPLIFCFVLWLTTFVHFNKHSWCYPALDGNWELWISGLATGKKKQKKTGKVPPVFIVTPLQCLKKSVYTINIKPYFFILNCDFGWSFIKDCINLQWTSVSFEMILEAQHQGFYFEAAKETQCPSLRMVTSWPLLVGRLIDYSNHHSQRLVRYSRFTEPLLLRPEWWLAVYFSH